MTTATKTLADLAAELRIGFAAKRGAHLPYDKRDDWQQSATDWRCVIDFGYENIAFDYWQGSALNYPPTVADCLESLLLDAEAGNQDFESFCGDFGYDTDSRKARATWRQCRMTFNQLFRMFGCAYNTLLYAAGN